MSAKSTGSSLLIHLLIFAAGFFGRGFYDDWQSPYAKITVEVDTIYVYHTITDTVTQNAIVGRSVSFKNLRPKKVFTVVNTAVYDTCPEPKAKIYLGAMLGGNITQFDFGPKATFITRRDHLYEFKYEVISETFWVGTEFKIHFRNIFRRRKK